MELVDEAPLLSEEVSLPAPARVDVLITGLDGETLGEPFTRVMCANPQLKVLGITVDARHAFLFELRPHRIPLGAASPGGLIDAIRTMTIPRRT